MGELGVERIPAHSPQAKGRVERRFQTVQDRVIKEMRLADVSTLEAANQFLEGYLPIDNQRVTVQPTQVADLPRPRPTSRDVDRSRCLKTARCLRKDFTIAQQGGRYQSHETVRAPVCWWKSLWTGRGGSRTRAGRSTFTRSRRGP